MISESLVCQDAKSNKFWNIETNDKTYTTSWGRIGTVGQSKKKNFYNKKTCEKEANKLIASKVKKGYDKAVTEELIIETFMMILSGIAEYRNPKELYYRSDKFSKLATIEFVDGSSDNIILRYYYESGKKKSEHEWVNGKQHGNDLGWNEKGKMRWERKFAAGKLIYEKRY